MSLVRDIFRSYLTPDAVVAKRLGMASEPRALATLMGACLLIFVSQWPVLSRQAHLDPAVTLDQRLGGAMLAWIFIMPLVLYALTSLLIVLARVFRLSVQALDLRFAIFWGLLAITPLWMLHGLLRGFTGNNGLTTVVGLAVLLGLIWIWLGGLRAALAQAGGATA